jgi:chorismate mutase
MTPEQAEQALAECRRKIDQLDLELRALLNHRAEIAEEIVQAKIVLGVPVRQPRREDEVIGKVTGENPGPLGADGLRRIFECIMHEIRELESSRLPENQPKGTPEW